MIKIGIKVRSPKLPDLSLDLILESANPVNMAKLAVSEWGNFRDKMNQLLVQRNLFMANQIVGMRYDKLFS